jgi:hypothetical protein
MIKLYWRDEEKQILVREMDATWTWDEYETNIDETKKLLESVEHPVIVLIDCCKVSNAVPENALHHISEANKDLPKNLSAQIIVSDSSWLQVMAALLRHLLPEEAYKYLFVRTMDKAEKQIAKLNKPKRGMRGRRSA